MIRPQKDKKQVIIPFGYTLLMINKKGVQYQIFESKI